MEYKVGKRYKLMGGTFGDICLLENASIFILDAIDGYEDDKLLRFRGASTGVPQIVHLSTIKAGRAIVKELLD